MTFALTGTYIQMAEFYNQDNIYLNIKNWFFLYNKYAKKKEKIILDTFTLQEIEKHMRMYIYIYIWVEVNRYHRKPEEERKRRGETSVNQITSIQKIFLLITTTGKMIIRARVRQKENDCNLTEENRFFYISQITKDH